MQDMIGDAFFLLQVWENRHVAWVQHLVVPFGVFFVLGSIVSVGSIAVKGRLFVEKLRTRGLQKRQLDGSEQLKIGNLALSFRLNRSHSKLESVAALQSKFDEHRMEQWRYYSYIASGVLEVRQHAALRCISPLLVARSAIHFIPHSDSRLCFVQDLPNGTDTCPLASAWRHRLQQVPLPRCLRYGMLHAGILNLLYMVNSFSDCVDKPQSCALSLKRTAILLFSFGTSAAMMGFKICHIEILRIKWYGPIDLPLCHGLRPNCAA